MTTKKEWALYFAISCAITFGSLYLYVKFVKPEIEAAVKGMLSLMAH